MWKETLAAWLDKAIDGVERIGLIRTIFVLLTVSVAIGIVLISKDFNKILKTILMHKREDKRVVAKIENERQRLEVALKSRKRKVPNSKGASKS